MSRPILFFVLLAAVCSVRGDVVTLKTGEKVEGTIVSETDTAVTVEYKVSAAVSDQKVIPKDQIDKIDKTTPDQIAYQDIKNFKVGPNSLPASSYDKIIAALKGFQTRFPESAFGRDVLLDLGSFEKERERVAGGEVKINNQWLTAEEAEKQRYQLNATALYSAMREQSKAGDLVGALNTFDAIEKSYPGARLYPEAVELAVQVLQALQRDLERREQALKFDKEQTQRARQTANEQQRVQIDAAVKREQTQADALIAQAKSSGLKWPPLLPRSEKSLAAIKTLLSNELKRVSDLPVDKVRRSLASADKAKEALDAGDPTTAADLVKEAKSLWSKNEMLVRLEAEMVDAKKTAAAEAAKVVAAAKVAATTPKPKPAAKPAAKAEPVAAAKPWFLTIPGALAIVGVVIVVLGGATLVSKLQKAKDDEAKP